MNNTRTIPEALMPQPGDAHIDLGIYPTQDAHRQGIIDIVSRDGYSMENYDPDINNWEIPVPDGYSEMPLKHTGHGESTVVVVWDPAQAKVQELTFDTYKGLQPEDEAKAMALEKEGWRLIAKGRYIEGKYESHYYLKRNEPAAEE